MLSNWALVGLGGACGAVLRYAVSVSLPSEGFPWATLTVNLVGSLMLGALTALVATQAMSEQHALLLGIGVLGSFTTLSTFSVEAVTLANEAKWASLGAYVVLTGVLAPLLALVGWKGAEALA
ncbi:MAG: fluoride efflux transporter CrcB [Candidatus Poseidonia sp.]|jgi:CrcB protein|nr:fluoride efflux transporter CrcB [Poseidonia sp.]